MISEVKVPSPGESISEVQIANWLAEDGSYVEKDMEIVEIDSDKATLSISAQESGTLQILVKEGETVDVGSVIARIDSEGKPPEQSSSPAGEVSKTVRVEEKPEVKASPEKKPEPQPEPLASKENLSSEAETEDKADLIHLSPLARKLLSMSNQSEKEFVEFLKSYRFSKKDVEFFMDEKDKPRAEIAATPVSWGGSRNSERKKLSTLRTKLAERLVSVKNETAMLTTFNEVNMSAIMNIRNQYKEIFKEKHGISLGFMSFFTKAITEALGLFPQVNAQFAGNEIIYFDYADISIAMSTPKGLLVPVLRNAEKMSLAEIEKKIKELATKARENKISLDEMKGGTFTITNGGVFGSMLSTPIINPPQSAILGMHNIVERPIAVNGKVEIHPVMYVALSYDHRIIDGKESVSFLVKVKEMLENPAKMLNGGKDPLISLLEL